MFGRALVPQVSGFLRVKPRSRCPRRAVYLLHLSSAISPGKATMRIQIPMLAAVAAVALAATGSGPASAAVASVSSVNHVASVAHLAAPLGTTNNPCYQKPNALHCDNTDPVATDCNIGSYVAASSPVYFYNANNGALTGGWSGYIQNWYSPHCGTNWARYVDTSGSYGTVSIDTCVNSPFHCTDMYDSNAFPAWSNQIYAKTVVSMASASFTNHNGVVAAGESRA
jgi:hypothetical protein